MLHWWSGNCLQELNHHLSPWNPFKMPPLMLRHNCQNSRKAQNNPKISSKSLELIVFSRFLQFFTQLSTAFTCGLQEKWICSFLVFEVWMFSLEDGVWSCWSTLLKWEGLSRGDHLYERPLRHVDLIIYPASSDRSVKLQADWFELTHACRRRSIFTPSIVCSGRGISAAIFLSYASYHSE